MLEVRSPTTADENGVSRKRKRIVIEYVGETAISVSWCRDGSQIIIPKFDDISVAYQDVRPGSAVPGDDRPASGKEGLQDAGPRDVVSVTVRVRCVQDFEAQLVDEPGVSGHLFQNRVDNHSLSGEWVGQYVGVCGTDLLE